MINMPARIVHSMPLLRRAALRSLLPPLLEALVRSSGKSGQLKGAAFREAEELLGTTVAACTSETIFVSRVREEAEGDG